MTCTSPPKIENGYVSYESLDGGAVWADNADVTYKCFNYYGLAGTNIMTCSSGSWTGTLPKCEWHRETEIVFWFSIAIMVLLVLLLIVLWIFVCCYFGLCGCGKRRKGKFDND